MIHVLPEGFPRQRRLAQPRVLQPLLVAGIGVQAALICAFLYLVVLEQVEVAVGHFPGEDGQLGKSILFQQVADFLGLLVVQLERSAKDAEQ